MILILSNSGGERENQCTVVQPVECRQYRPRQGLLLQYSFLGARGISFPARQNRPTFPNSQLLPLLNTRVVICSFTLALLPTTVCCAQSAAEARGGRCIHHYAPPPQHTHTHTNQINPWNFKLIQTEFNICCRKLYCILCVFIVNVLKLICLEST